MLLCFGVARGSSLLWFTLLCQLELAPDTICTKSSGHHSLVLAITQLMEQYQVLAAALGCVTAQRLFARFLGTPLLTISDATNPFVWPTQEHGGPLRAGRRGVSLPDVKGRPVRGRRLRGECVNEAGGMVNRVCKTAHPLRAVIGFNTRPSNTLVAT